MREQTATTETQAVRPPVSKTLKTGQPMPVVETKTEALRKLLLRPNGATGAQIQRCLIWQPHTVRAAISRLRTSGVVIELDQSGKVARYRAVSMEIAQ